jgi:hypothetical protein
VLLVVIPGPLGVNGRLEEIGVEPLVIGAGHGAS